MLTLVHKVIHLVIGTFNKRVVKFGYKGKKLHRRPRQRRRRSLYVIGRWSRLDWSVRSVAAEGVCFDLRPDAGRVRLVSADVR